MSKQQAYMPPSKSDIHETPDKIYDWIKETYGWSKEQLNDPCPVNPICNALHIVWDTINFVNPPYTLLSDFVAHAIRQADEYGCISIMLLPAKTDQQWFHSLVAREYDIHWIKGRLKFKGHKYHATQPHFLVLIK